MGSEVKSLLSVHDLDEMDLVLLRSGDVCWVLRNDYDGKLQLFGRGMWGLQGLEQYYEDFTYGKDLKVKDMSRSERYKYHSKDIVAVHKCNSKWKSISLMQNYNYAYENKDADSKHLLEVMNSFDWQRVKS